MRQLTLDQQEELRRAVQVAAGVAGLAEEIDAVYQDVEAEIASRRPRCDQSGRCCRFDEFGHLLFVTTAELAVFLGKLPVVSSELRGKSAATAGGRRLHVLNLLVTRNSQPETSHACVYQINNLCSVHSIRPFGCRIFFCDPTAQDWQQRHYELFHHRLKALHKRLGVPYLYVEWRQALAAVNGPKRVADSNCL